MDWRGEFEERASRVRAWEEGGSGEWIIGREETGLDDGGAIYDGGRWPHYSRDGGCN
jgi:hypothetical protein